MKNYFSWGNKKLPKTTAIFNMTPAMYCPARRLHLCALGDKVQRCYALKAEKIYKNVLEYRIRQSIFWSDCTTEEFIAQLFKEKKRKQLLKLRFNESGDFVSQSSLIKAEKIAKLLYKEYGIITYCYTARKDLNYSTKKYLIINGSGFMVDNNYSITGMSQPTPNYKVVSCPGNCRTCSLCVQSNKLNIQTKMH